MQLENKNQWTKFSASPFETVKKELLTTELPIQGSKLETASWTSKCSCSYSYSCNDNVPTITHSSNKAAGYFQGISNFTIHAIRSMFLLRLPMSLLMHLVNCPYNSVMQCMKIFMALLMQIKAEDPQHVAHCLALLEHELTLLTSNNMECAYQKVLLIEQDQGAAVSGSAGDSASTKRNTAAAAAIAPEGAAGSCSFVQGDDFWLMFLRANEWNVKLAAKWMIGFLELKLKLFGMEKLCRNIVLDDLKEGDDGDWNYVKCGYFQQIPLKDRLGRTILMVWPQFPMEYSAQNVVRNVT
jgi:hypothetical protein